MSALTAPAEILLVEDDRAAIRLVQEALKGSALSPHLSVAQDGDQAVAMLRRQGHHAGAPRPALILLDLNLPGTDGFGVLGAVKGDPALRDIPVAVLSTSRAPADIRRSYDLGANCYIAKPRELGEVLRVIGLTADFWLSAVTLPSA